MKKFKLGKVLFSRKKSITENTEEITPENITFSNLLDDLDLSDLYVTIDSEVKMKESSVVGFIKNNSNGRKKRTRKDNRLFQ